jgi:hypothetical protein
LLPRVHQTSRVNDLNSLDLTVTHDTAPPLASSPPLKSILKKETPALALATTVTSAPNHTSTAILDTGCSGHYLAPNAPCINKHEAHPSISVELPNGAILHSSHTATVDLHPALPIAAGEAHVFPDFGSKSLLSIGQLCDNGCTATFTADAVDIAFNGNIILSGKRSPPNKLWQMDLQSEMQPDIMHTSFCNAVNPNTTMAERIAYYHACCGSPVLSTWCTAIDEGRFTTWPELTSHRS